MGTTVSSLQILGASLEDVRAALPRALVGQWSERFVTACPELTFQHLERKAGTLSKKLDCTILSVSMFDGDAVSLTVFQSGKRLTTHSVAIETGELKVGNPKLFCSALGLPEELAPKLKRLFTDCSSQEDKLHILQALLGAPLFLRWDDPDDRFPTKPVQEDPDPLERWLKEHPAPPKPPKIKNQCRAEMIQEITDLCYYGHLGGNLFLFRPLVHVRDEEENMREWLKKRGRKDEDVLGVESCNGKLGRLQPDGSLKLTPLEDPAVTFDLIKYLFESGDVQFDHFIYAAQGDRLVTAALFLAESGFQSYSSYQTVVLRDSAGILPCYLPLEADGEPVVADRFFLLPDGGFLAVGKPHCEFVGNRFNTRWGRLYRYGPDGTLRYAVTSESDLPEDDAASLHITHDLDEPLASSVTDSQGRHWIYREKYVECYTPENKLISRHRLPGHVSILYCNDDGQACAITNDWKKYITRVYRFT